MRLNDKDKVQLTSIIKAIHVSVKLEEWGDVRSLLDVLLPTPS